MTTTGVLLGEDEHLFGLLTKPDGPAAKGVLILNAGMLPSMGPYRVFAELADCLAASGYAVLRIDQSGKGESPIRRDVSHGESLLLDYRDALSHFRSLGLTETVLIGICSGAADAMQIARSEPSVQGLVLTDGFAERNWRVKTRYYTGRLLTWEPYRDRLQRLLREREQQFRAPRQEFVNYFLESWEDPEGMRNCYLDLLGRGVDILSVFTGSWFWYYNKHGQLARSLTGAKTIAGLTELYMPGANHTFVSSQQRRELFREISGWLDESFPAD